MGKKSPLNVFVIWDESFADGRRYADELFQSLAYKSNEFNGDNIGIPIYFITNPLTINLDIVANAEKTAFILLIDSNMVLKPTKWAYHIQQLISLSSETKNKTAIMYPVVFCSNKAVRNLNNDLSNINFLTLNDKSLEDKDNKFINRVKKLKFEITHELCRFLYNRERTSECKDNLSASVEIFISYAREDGSEIAKEINRHISSKTQLKTFIDVNDIPKGENFQDVIDSKIQSGQEGCVLLSILTDKYSSRNVCQGEVLTAKREGLPIVLLDALSTGEVRRFPYGANEKTIHLGHSDITDERVNEIVYEILIETLKEKYNDLFLKYIADLYDLGDKVTIFNNPPELYTLLMSLDNSNEIVVYPEPPLNTNEMQVLKKFKEHIIFATPTNLPLVLNNGNKAFCGEKIGLSISELLEEGDGIKTNTHLKAFYVELCRYLLSAGADLAYCGKLKYGDHDFTRILIDLAEAYRFDDNKARIYLYKDEANHISLEEQEELLPYIKLENVDCKKSGNSENIQTIIRKVAAKDTLAQIVVGGKTKSLRGKIPGLLEESCIALENKKPIYILGAFGGCGELIAKILKGEDVVETDKTIIEKIKKVGINGLNNGLSEEENLELFESSDFARIISLIIKGISNEQERKSRIISNI